MNFLEVWAIPAMQRMVEKRTFGGTYVRLGRLFITVGTFIFQQGGVLGYACREQPLLVVKVCGMASAKSIDELRPQGASRLAEVENREHSFLELFAFRELRELGIDPSTWPPSKKLEEKVDLKDAWQLLVVAFISGVALGYHFPETFVDYWKNTYRMRPNAEWQSLRAMGLDIPETQQEQPLERAVTDLAEAMAAWAAKDAPGLLTGTELQFLGQLTKK